VPQDVRGELPGPAGQTQGGGFGQRPAEHIGGGPRTGAVGVLAFRGEQRSAGPGVVKIELAPHSGDEPAQVAVRAVDQGTSRGLGPLRREPLP
jgi:hypothetical protein